MINTYKYIFVILLKHFSFAKNYFYAKCLNKTIGKTFLEIRKKFLTPDMYAAVLRPGEMR